MPSHLFLRPAERRTLLRYYRRHPNPEIRLRAHIILMLADGYAWTVIRSVLYCSPDTINHWRHRFKSGGVEALSDRKRGAEARWSDEADTILREAMGHSPQEWGYRAVSWTVSLLRDHLERQWGQKPT